GWRCTPDADAGRRRGEVTSRPAGRRVTRPETSAVTAPRPASNASPPRILIVQPETGPADRAEPLGFEVRTILQREEFAQVALLPAPRPDTPASAALAIPTPRTPRQQSRDFLTALRQKDPDLPLLPVLRAADLDEQRGFLLSCVPDFIVTPLRE